MKHRLTGSIFYLSGGIDRVPDRGVGWRKEIKEFLWNMDIGVLDPCDKPINFGTEDEENIRWRLDSIERAKHLYERGHSEDADDICEAISESMKKVVAADLRMLDMCHAVILYLDMDVFTCGTFTEMTYACLEKKPIIVNCKQGKMNAPHWMFGVIPMELIFSSWDEVRKYIIHIAHDTEINHLKKWRFFDMNKVYGREIF